MHRILLAAAAIIALSAADVFADAFSDAVISDLQLNGYNNIEITTGPTQLKVEASDGVNRIEIIYDLATGEILVQEIEPLGDDDIAPGVTISSDDDVFWDDDDDDDGNDDEDGDSDDND